MAPPRNRMMRMAAAMIAAGGGVMLAGVGPRPNKQAMMADRRTVMAYACVRGRADRADRRTVMAYACVRGRADRDACVRGRADRLRRGHGRGDTWLRLRLLGGDRLGSRRVDGRQVAQAQPGRGDADGAGGEHQGQAPGRRAGGGWVRLLRRR